ncbi:hypothetical protein DB32_006439 [Sandaracinus amylolyticus]|uniref:Uncharacterized protein n=1 Tax=Sandaracinus amylolyticus TaxID=927083 RepID=A0A0F6W7K1_9BACT|nr:hypothetical protein DB32_006439 [Sandaracinus amylolyticus]
MSRTSHIRFAMRRASDLFPSAWRPVAGGAVADGIVAKDPYVAARVPGIDRASP